MKKVLVMIFLFLGIIDAKALVYEDSFKGGEVIPGVFIKKINSKGEVEDKKGQLIVDSKNEFVYCIEPFNKVKPGEIYEVYEDDFLNILNISKEVFDKINLLAYYGYGYYGHTDLKWYEITQILIWRELDPTGSFTFTDYFGGPTNNELFKEEINELNRLVEEHYIKPDFQIPEVFVGDKITIMDKNNVLDKYDIVGDNVKKDGNNIILNIDKEDFNFKLEKNITTTNPFIYVSSNSQNIIKGYANIKVDATYNIKAKKPVGKIIIKKYGETLDLEDNNFSFYLKELKGVRFTLYDINDKLIASNVTDNNGEIVFTNLYEGKYYLKEESTLDGYIKDDKIYYFNLKVDEYNKINDQFMSIKNELKKGKIKILKKDEVTNDTLSDTEFAIYKDNVLVFVGVTNSEGILEVDNLPYGNYQIKETRAKDNYINKNEIIDIIINEEDKEIMVEIFNIPDTSINYLNNREIVIDKKRFIIKERRFSYGIL